MYRLPAKFKLIFLPYLLVSVGTIGLYTFLNWLLLLKLQLFRITDSIVNIYTPIILSLIVVIIWLRPRIQLIDFKKPKRYDHLVNTLAINWLSIAVPLVTAQFYLVTATGKLTSLNYISEVNYLPATKYYTVKHFYINKGMTHIKVVFHVGGKNSSDFNIQIYAAVPVFDHIFPDTNQVKGIRDANPRALAIINDKVSSMQQLKKLPADSIRIMRYVNPSMVMLKYGETGKYGAIITFTKGYRMKTEPRPMKISPIAWLAIEYSSTIKNSLPALQKSAYYKMFFGQAINALMHKPLDSFNYLARLPYSSDNLNFKAAVESRGDVEAKEPIILSPVYEKYADRNGNRLAWILGSFALGSTIFLIILNFVNLKKIKMDL